MDYLDPHIHMVSRITDDYETLARMGCVGVSEPAFVKIDVEGAELDVLRGMSQTIQSHRPIIVYEVDDGDPAAFERKQGNCRSFLHPFGYRIAILEDSYPGGAWKVANFIAVAEETEPPV